MLEDEQVHRAQISTLSQLLLQQREQTEAQE